MPDPVCNYDNSEKMSSKQLEFAWLASIFWEPEVCRSLGLLGLDASMFKNGSYFDWGLRLLRSKFTNWQNIPEDIFEELRKSHLLAPLSSTFDDFVFMPSFYRVYAREIENRCDHRWESSW